MRLGPKGPSSIRSKHKQGLNAKRIVRVLLRISYSSCAIMPPEDVERWVCNQIWHTVKRGADLRLRIDLALAARRASYDETLALNRADSTVTSLSFSPRRTSTPLNGVVVLPSGIIFVPRQTLSPGVIITQAMVDNIYGMLVSRARLVSPVGAVF